MTTGFRSVFKSTPVNKESERERAKDRKKVGKKEGKKEREIENLTPVVPEPIFTNRRPADAVGNGVTPEASENAPNIAEAHGTELPSSSSLSVIESISGFPDSFLFPGFNPGTKSRPY